MHTFGARLWGQVEHRGLALDVTYKVFSLLWNTQGLIAMATCNTILWQSPKNRRWFQLRILYSQMLCFYSIQWVRNTTLPFWPTFGMLGGVQIAEEWWAYKEPSWPTLALGPKYIKTFDIPIILVSIMSCPGVSIKCIACQVGSNINAMNSSLKNGCWTCQESCPVEQLTGGTLYLIVLHLPLGENDWFIIPL